MLKDIMTPWQRLTNMLELDKKDILQVFYYAIFAGIVSLSLPLGIQAIINLIQGAQISTSWIVLVVLVTLGVAFGGALQYMQMRIIENVQQKIFTRSSFEFAYRFPKIKMSELRNYYPPELANRFFDTLTVQKGLSKILIDFPAAILQIVLGLLLLSFYHPFFIIYGILLVLLVYVVFKYTARKGLETSLRESRNKYRVAHWIQEVARSIVSFKLSGKTSLAMSKNDDLVADYLESRESHFKVLLFQFLQMIGFKVLVTAGLLIIGGVLVLNQEMNIGQFVAAEIIIILVISSVEKLILGLESFYDILTSLEKIGQVVDKELESQTGELVFENSSNMKIELEDVSYYVDNGKKRILSNISVVIDNSSRILVEGHSGSGKSSLLRIISGIVEPSDGSIYVNDVSLNSVQLNHYRANIGQSLTEESPFEGTLLENITFGNNDIPMEDVRWAIENAALSQYIKEQPDGLNTIIYPEGKQMPHAIIKKILLARSIVTKPKVLVLKDPLDQFEKEEAQRIMNFLTDPRQPWGLVVVSYNPEWKKQCNSVIKLEKGSLVK